MARAGRTRSRAVSPANPFTRRVVALPTRGEGALAILDFGPRERACDLVFLHANGFNALTYRRILAPLAADFRVFAVDQRGHGGSSLPSITAGRIDWHDFRDDFVALLEALDVHDAVLSGHSMGGTSCLMAAAQAPHRARRLVLLDPVILPWRSPAPDPPAEHGRLVEGARRRRAHFTSRASAFAAYHRRAGFASWPDDMLTDYLEDGFTELAGGGVTLTCAPEWEASTFAAQANDPWQAFADARCPIDILRAEHGSTCRTEGQEHALSASGLVTIETVPGTSHFLPMERPDMVTERLRRALLS